MRRRLFAAHALALLCGCDSFADPPESGGRASLPEPDIGFAGSGNVGGGPAINIGTGGVSGAGGTLNTGGALIGTGGIAALPARQPQAFGISLQERVTGRGLAGGGVEQIVLHPDGGVVIAGEELIGDRRGLSVVKLAPDGETEWSRWIETKANGFGGMAIDADGQLLVAGRFQGVIEVDGHRIEGDVSDAADPNFVSDAFVLKLDANGTVVRLHCFGGVGLQESSFLFRLPDGDYLLGLVYTGRVALGDIELTSTFGALGRNMALVRLNSEGEPLAAHVFVVDALITAAAMDSVGNVVFSGWVPDSVTRAQIDLGPSWILKVDPEGTPMWSRTLDPTSPLDVTAIAVDSTDAILVAATPVSGGSFLGEPLGEHAFALGKLDTDGSSIFTRMYGTSYAYVGQMAIGEDDSITLAGAFGESVDFGGGALTCGDFVAMDAFVAQLDRDGAHRFSFSAGSAGGLDAATALAIDGTGRLIVAGWLGGAIDFGQGAFETEHDAFVAWIAP